MNILAAKNSSIFGLAGITAKLTPTAGELSIYLASGLSSSPPHTVTSEKNRQYTTHELCRTYSRYMELLNLHPSAPLLSPWLSSGLHIVPTMNGARERRNNGRFQMSRSLHSTVKTYIRIWLAFQRLERIHWENYFWGSPTKSSVKKGIKKHVLNLHLLIDRDVE